MTRVADSVAALRRAVAAFRQQGASIAFVPTMGNLHRGHMRLMDQARQAADVCVVSIYVNPMQFNQQADLAAYPRTPDADRDKLRQAGVQLLFEPDDRTMYPHGMDQQTFVEVPNLGDMLEGEHRPGHFRGVATVVNRLFNLVQPDIAVFGKKDYQQLMLIRKMVADLAMPVTILAGETEREADGLAMSSRNARLSSEQRRIAPRLHEALCEIREVVAKSPDNTRKVVKKSIQDLGRTGFEVEYLSLRRRSDLLPPQPGDQQLVVLAAAVLGDVRLIDNMEIEQTS